MISRTVIYHLLYTVYLCLKWNDVVQHTRSDQSLDPVGRGDMVDTLCDSKWQASLSSAHLVRVGLSSLVGSFRLSAHHFTCSLCFLLSSRDSCITVLGRRLGRMMWLNHASIQAFTFLLIIIVYEPIKPTSRRDLHCGCEWESVKFLWWESPYTSVTRINVSLLFLFSENRWSSVSMTWEYR